MWTRTTTLVVGLVSITACDGHVTASEETAPADPRVAIVDGDDQTGAPGQVLRKQLTVAVLDGDGDPLGGVEIVWGVRSGGGTVAPARGLTDHRGRASSAWRLGMEIGARRQIAEASPGSAPLTRVVFVASARCGSRDGDPGRRPGTAASVVPSEDC